ncbi:helix-turn-helix transcriptional regulator [Rhodoferax sp. PAMC 29310]|uniref:helix-turn-helix domain-containing protein n=1 Tax=Rhodoferax sp. PAMC 29310 TaxID=2822760 RepID=UPI001B32B1EE|nr:helix-turn-helix transcriptional regulator [Rhodoferax sp. PAMC 29310]
MKYKEEPLLTAPHLAESVALGAKLARLRHARKLRQVDAAARAGLARSTAVLIEKGDPSRTLGQIFRYLEAIAPGVTLLASQQEADPALTALAHAEATQRVRALSPTELGALDF